MHSCQAAVAGQAFSGQLRDTLEEGAKCCRVGLEVRPVMSNAVGEINLGAMRSAAVVVGRFWRAFRVALKFHFSYKSRSSSHGSQNLVSGFDPQFQMRAWAHAIARKKIASLR